MGGILAAEVALLPSQSSNISGAQQFRHRILGMINFDCPFLGMHPGIVVSGIGSLLRPAPLSPEIQVPRLNTEDHDLGLHLSSSHEASSPMRSPLPSSRTGPPLMDGENFSAGTSEGSTTQGSTVKDLCSHSSPSDSSYDPPFPNDIRLPQRKGWDNALHFVTKHSHNLTKAATAYVTSHLEFGASVADYKGLQSRYMRLRPLEDIETPHDGARRVRFLNYYTTCNGRPKKPKPVAEGGCDICSSNADAETKTRQNSEHDLQGLQNQSLSTVPTQSLTPSPRISVEEHRDGEVHPKTAEDIEGPQIIREESPLLDEGIVMSKGNLAEDTIDRPGSVSSRLEPSTKLEPSALTLTTLDELYSLPPLPCFPEAPQRYDPATYSDPNSRNLAYRQYSTEFKSYMRALKAYDHAIRDRLKSVEKQEKGHDKSRKISKPQEGKKPRRSSESPEGVPASGFPAKGSEDESHGRLSPQTKRKVPTGRRFCVLPPRINSQRDPCWVQVFMKDVDEVGAHCGLFVPGDHYGWLVNDVGTRIQGWVEGM